MFERVVKQLDKHTITFEGGDWAEIVPPEGLKVGDTVILFIVGVLRRSVSSMEWTDQDGETHFVRYEDGVPV